MPKLSLRRLLLLAGWLSLGFAVCQFSCNALEDALCANTVLRSVPSPDGELTAVIFDRGCGATTGFSEQVSVVAAGARLPNKGGDVFVADDGHGAAPGGPKVRVAWEGNSRLLVRYHPKARTFHQTTSVWAAPSLLRRKRITVRYEAVP